MNTKKLLGLIAIVFCCQIVSAQSHHCGTDQSDSFMQDLRKNKPYFEQTRNKSRVERFVPITFHAVADSQGEGRVSDQVILESLCVLNQRFEDTEMRFYLQNINRINNDAIYSNPGTNAGRTAMNNFRSTSSLNVFVANFAGEGVAGFYTRNPDVVVMVKRFLGDDAYTLEHELGHFFSLAHTHRGWDQIQQTNANGDVVVPANSYTPGRYGDTIRITTVSSTQAAPTLIELVDGSNCTRAGDEICDTDPDYGFGAGSSCGCCTLIYDVWDSNFDKIESEIDNIMSYSSRCGSPKFTEGQVTAMFADFDSNRRNYLRGGSVDIYNPITENTTLLTPSTGSIVENFNGVFFDWEDVPNAEEYILRIDGDLSLEYSTTSSEFFVEDLDPNGLYFWQIVPSNKFGSSCLREDVVIFETGSGTTSVNEIEGFTNVGIHPNPVESGVDLNIFITSDNTLDARITLIDITGKMVMAQNDVIQNGNNQIKLRTSSVGSGLYVVQVQTESGRITEKVFIK
ncbi:zinc-dependent metalloprotease [Saprospiraceae bacterium]|nr:zinc-dependent metalloprotease [Saprospiraceae bacterium]